MHKSTLVQAGQAVRPEKISEVSRPPCRTHQVRRVRKPCNDNQLQPEIAQTEPPGQFATA